MRHRASIGPLILFVVISALTGQPQSTFLTVEAHQSQLFQGAFIVSANPSSILVKVGERANVSVTVANVGDVGQVCFDLEGFPDSGFRTTFIPGCIRPRDTMSSVLAVEATPAAAPQSFTASIIAKAGGQTAQTSLSVTVEPAMPAWIPWLGIVLFFLLLGIVTFWRPKIPFRRAKTSSRRRKR